MKKNSVKKSTDELCLIFLFKKKLQIKEERKRTTVKRGAVRRWIENKIIRKKMIKKKN